MSEREPDERAVAIILRGGSPALDTPARVEASEPPGALVPHELVKHARSFARERARREHARRRYQWARFEAWCEG